VPGLLAAFPGANAAVTPDDAVLILRSVMTVLHDNADALQEALPSGDMDVLCDGIERLGLNNPAAPPAPGAGAPLLIPATPRAPLPRLTCPNAAGSPCAAGGAEHDPSAAGHARLPRDGAHGACARVRT